MFLYANVPSFLSISLSVSCRLTAVARDAVGKKRDGQEREREIEQRKAKCASLSPVDHLAARASDCILCKSAIDPFEKGSEKCPLVNTMVNNCYLQHNDIKIHTSNESIIFPRLTARLN